MLRSAGHLFNSRKGMIRFHPRTLDSLNFLSRLGVKRTLESYTATYKRIRRQPFYARCGLISCLFFVAVNGWHYLFAAITAAGANQTPAKRDSLHHILKDRRPFYFLYTSSHCRLIVYSIPRFVCGLYIIEYHAAGKRGEFADTDDLYVLGLNSLKTTEPVMMLETGLSKDHKNTNISWLPSHSIYGAPKVVKLAAAF
jgi:hypothetical protein